MSGFFIPEVVSQDIYDSISSDEDENTYSDKNSSDLETELYGQIYFAPNISDSSLCENAYVLDSESSYCGNTSVLNSSIESGHQVCPSEQSPNYLNIKNAVPAQPTTLFLTNNANSFEAKYKSDVDSSLSDDSSILPTRSSDAERNDVVINMQNASRTCEEKSSESSSSNSSVVLSDASQKLKRKNLTPFTAEEGSSSDDGKDILSYSISRESEDSTINLHQDNWHLDPADLFRPFKLSNRYYRKRMEVSNCRNCRQIGHTYKECPNANVRKCYICGGNHVAIGCKRKVCGICYKVGHSRHYCIVKAQRLSCGLCAMAGHSTNRCPDNWRRYHLTTSIENGIVKVPRSKKMNGLMYCYNCGQAGHFGHECNLPRHNHSLPSSPYVISYKDFTSHFNSTTKISQKLGKMKRKAQVFDSGASPKLKPKKEQSIVNISQLNSYKRKNNSTQLSLGESSFSRVPGVNDFFSKRKNLSAKVRSKKKKKQYFN